jgi:gliding motility-associated-like protein
MFSARMTKAGLLVVCFCLFFLSYQSQVNLVPNPSFEQVTGFIPGFQNEIRVARPWDSLRNGGGDGGLIKGPSVMIAGTVFYQVARTGIFYAALTYYIPPPTNGWRSYIQAPLNSKLIPNKSYCVTGYFNLWNNSKYSVDELSFYFDDGSISSGGGIGQVALANPQIKSPAGIFFNDTLNWIKVQGKFTAIGTESYITIGNHKPDANLSFSLAYPSVFNNVSAYNVDDVSVIDADLPAYAGRDTVLCAGDSVFIGRPPEIGLECLWFNNGSQIATGGGIWVKPTTSQTYIVQQDVCGLIKRDTIQVQLKPKYSGPQIGLVASSATTCPTNTITISITNNPPITGNYFWLPLGVYTQTNNVIAKAMVSQNTVFTLNINNNGQDAFCPFQRTASVIVSVPIFTDSSTLVSSSNPVCPNDTIVFSILNPAPGNTVTYQWLPLAAFSFTSSLLAKSITQIGSSFSVNVSSTGNSSICAFTRSLNILISVADSCFKEPMIPNIFTPNNDNSNDVWGIKFPYGYSLQFLYIYDRWGTLIYQLNNLTFDKQGYALIGWDGYTTSGEPCSAGVYFYVLSYTDRASRQKTLKGNLTLLR